MFGAEAVGQELRQGVAADLPRPVHQQHLHAGVELVEELAAQAAGGGVARPAATEVTSAGAAYLAGLSCGYWTERDLRAIRGEEEVFAPSADEDKRQALLSGWERALRRARTR